jgi:hypothetical protein
MQTNTKRTRDTELIRICIEVGPVAFLSSIAQLPMINKLARIVIKISTIENSRMRYLLSCRQGPCQNGEVKSYCSFLFISKDTICLFG